MLLQPFDMGRGHAMVTMRLWPRLKAAPAHIHAVISKVRAYPGNGRVTRGGAEKAFLR